MEGFLKALDERVEVFAGAEHYPMAGELAKKDVATLCVIYSVAVNQECLSGKLRTRETWRTMTKEGMLAEGDVVDAFGEHQPGWFGCVAIMDSVNGEQTVAGVWANTVADKFHKHSNKDNKD